METRSEVLLKAIVNIVSSLLLGVIMSTTYPAYAGNAEALNSSKEITAFALAGTAAVITGQDILWSTAGNPGGRYIATFTTTGASVTVNGVPQISGVTENTFGQALVYVVTAADGSSKSYTVTTKFAPPHDPKNPHLTY